MRHRKAELSNSELTLAHHSLESSIGLLSLKDRHAFQLSDVVRSLEQKIVNPKLDKYLEQHVRKRTITQMPVRTKQEVNEEN